MCKYLDSGPDGGLGGSLFIRTYPIILQDSLTDHMEVETRTRTERRTNAYFKIEFG